jgi:hypothetical protein
VDFKREGGNGDTFFRGIFVTRRRSRFGKHRPAFPLAYFPTSNGIDFLRMLTLTQSVAPVHPPIGAFNGRHTAVGDLADFRNASDDRSLVVHVLSSIDSASSIRFDPDPMKVARTAAKIQSNPDEKKAME